MLSIIRTQVLTPGNKHSNIVRKYQGYKRRGEAGTMGKHQKKNKMPNKLLAPASREGPHSLHLPKTHSRPPIISFYKGQSLSLSLFLILLLLHPRIYLLLACLVACPDLGGELACPWLVLSCIPSALLVCLVWMAAPPRPRPIGWPAG